MIWLTVRRMAKKRTTPEDDYERLAERIANQYPFAKDREGFEKAFENYMGDSKLTAAVYDDVKQKTLTHYASKMDFIDRDFDSTPIKRVEGKGKAIKSHRKDYPYVGYIRRTVKGKRIDAVVYAERVLIKYNSGPRYKFRDRFGRFVSPKRRKTK